MKTSHTYQLIDKSLIAELSWPSEDLNKIPEKRNNLLKKLNTALILGNIEKNKCRIIFQDSSGIKKTETTIWAVCEKNILIKFGHWIPIRRIIDIEF